MNLDRWDLPIREIKWVEESCTEACLHHRKWFGCGLSQPWRRVLVDCFVEVVVGVLWGHGGPNCLCQSRGLRVWWLGRLTLLAFRGFVGTAGGGWTIGPIRGPLAKHHSQQRFTAPQIRFKVTQIFLRKLDTLRFYVWFFFLICLEVNSYTLWFITIRNWFLHTFLIIFFLSLGNTWITSMWCEDRRYWFHLTTIFFCLVKGHFWRGKWCPVSDLTDIYYYLRIAIFIWLFVMFWSPLIWFSTAYNWFDLLLV